MLAGWAGLVGGAGSAQGPHFSRPGVGKLINLIPADRGERVTMKATKTEPCARGIFVARKTRQSSQAAYSYL